MRDENSDRDSSILVKSILKTKIAEKRAARILNGKLSISRRNNTASQPARPDEAPMMNGESFMGIALQNYNRWF